MNPVTINLINRLTGRYRDRTMAWHCYLLEFGRVDYPTALELQENVVKSRLLGRGEDVLILLEHSPVITIGRGGGSEDILVPLETLERMGVKIYQVPRGGRVTYHGPGQLVGYPCLDLRRYGKDVHGYLRLLEEVLIRVLDGYNVKARRVTGHAGVWVGGKKIAAIGIHVRRWITSHGFALNVSTDLGYFDMIVPCGVKNRAVTSLEQLLGRTLDMKEVRQRLVECWCDVFKVQIQPVDLQVLETWIQGSSRCF